MKSKSNSRALAGVLLIALLVTAVAASGCGSASKGASASGSTPAGQGATEEDPAVSELKTRDEKQAATEAIRHAADANTGSTFKVIDIQVTEGWARVGLEETGVPVEEAVGFGVYLRRLGGARWEVVTSGTDVSPDEIPDAPAGICQ